jgi:formylglycine-generating enzyme required for sulfatase activity
MARIEKTVFISYRRKDISWALAVYQDLTHQGYDVFFDYTSIPSGDFEQIIISNIKARAHFVLILTPTTLDRCSQTGDWLRREIEIAIDEKRNIIPLFFNGFNFGADNVSEKLTGKLKKVSQYNGMNVYQDFFSEAMTRLRTKFLNVPLTAVLHPVSAEVQEVVLEEQRAANKAAEQAKAKTNRDGAELRKKKQKEFIDGVLKSISSNFRKFAIGGIILISILCVLFAGNYFLKNLPVSETPEITSTKIATTSTIQPTTTATKSLAISTTTKLNIGSTDVGNDGMLLMYVPAGEFTMGSDSDSDEQPIHQVHTEAFWIDQTEVTNAMYARCVNDNQCDPPNNINSDTHESYFGNSEFDDFPVIYVSWEDAKAYCQWAERRLPTEAEWEKASRGTDARIYPWGNAEPKDSLLNFNQNIGDTTEVGSYPQGASIYGTLDMSGNVWEWVNDWYDSTYYQNSPSSNPLGPSTGEYKVLRGGSWYDSDNSVRSANRDGSNPTYTNSNIGFRCSRSP